LDLFFLNLADSLPFSNYASLGLQRISPLVPLSPLTDSGQLLVYSKLAQMASSEVQLKRRSLASKKLFPSLLVPLRLENMELISKRHLSGGFPRKSKNPSFSSKQMHFSSVFAFA
jgi:hypothetical protein